MKEGRSVPRRLSRAQAAFAAHQQLDAGIDAANGSGVFFYREHERYTERWLISRSGSVIDIARFSRSGRD